MYIYNRKKKVEIKIEIKIEIEMREIDVAIYIEEIKSLGEGVKRDREIGKYLGREPQIFPQLRIMGAPNETTSKMLKSQDKVELRWLEKHLYKTAIEPWKSVTTWYLATLLYNNIPIGIITKAEESEGEKFFPINYRQHNYAAAYLFNYIKADPGPELEPYDTYGPFSGDVKPEYTSIDLPYYDLNSLSDFISLETSLNQQLSLFPSNLS